MFPDRPRLVFQNDKDELSRDYDEAATVSALFDLMNSDQNFELTDALVVSNESYSHTFMNLLIIVYQFRFISLMQLK